MIKFVSVFLTLIVTSLYLFPFELIVLKGVNSKMVLALLGGILFFLKLVQERTVSVNKRVFLLFICGCLVSLVGVFSAVYNNTPDYAYATYLVSMLVWMSGAYFVCRVIRLAHEECNLRVLCNYMIAVCVIQCILALYIDLSPWFKHLVDEYIEQGQDFLNGKKVKRLYGIGASLDVAGSRFAAVLTVVMYQLITPWKGKRCYHYLLYMLAFILIGLLGNMIARTTLIGLVLALGYLAWVTFKYLKNLGVQNLYVWRWLIPVLILSLPLIVYSYQTNQTIHKNVRFGFEGFFSLAEKGRWEVSSNDRLKTMYVFPESLKTWVVGDGYFSNPSNTDPNFIGQKTGGYYMGTDVGYLRFIFYFGLLGLTVFSFFFIAFGVSCIHKHPDYKALFIMVLAVNFVVWMKVSTDIFLILALLFSASEKIAVGEKTENKEIA